LLLFSFFFYHLTILVTLLLLPFHVEDFLVYRVVAHPLLLKWNGMMWEPKRAMNNRADENLRSKNLPFSAAKSVKWSAFISLLFSVI